ncbi:MAG: hypothetical protein Q9190_004939 [Brigantiaea leucoxantha]
MAGGHPYKTWASSKKAGNEPAVGSSSWRQKIKSHFHPTTPSSESNSTQNDTYSRQQEVFWPKDYLAKDLGEAVIWTYGYNADVIGGLFQANSKNSVSGHGRDLAVRLERDIENRVTQPIPKSRKTPGSTWASWGEIASNLARVALQDSHKKIVETLAVDSEVLDNIHEQFVKAASDHDIRIHSFQEGRGMSGIKGLDEKVVSDFSSKIGLPNVETVESIDANHTQMARCKERSNESYRFIVGVLKHFLKNTNLNTASPLGPVTQIQRDAISSAKDLVGALFPAPPLPPSYQLGLNLGDAPQIVEQLFVGREDELAHLYRWLSPSSEEQNVVAISGLGGMGKTQLGLRFARQHHQRYSAVIWLNASSEVTLKAAYVSLAQRIRRHNQQSETRRGEVMEQLKEEQTVQLVRQWLSQAENKTWLLMFDNYDDPRLPGIRSTTGYDIRSFFPYSTQGSILITTRSSRITFAKLVRLRKFDDLNQSLAVLTRRSGRQAQEDVDAKKLAKRFDGLPLALATAGDYISQTADSFGDYFQMYEQSWDELAENSDGLMEYDDRTLYSTWNLSLKQVAAQDPQAAELFRLMGYLGNADLWYELFRKGARSVPDWFYNITKSKARFNKAMATLHSYSLIEAMPGVYSLHACVHDWVWRYLIGEFDLALFRLATHCIAQNVAWESMPEYWVVNSRLSHHALRIERCQESEVVDWNVIDIEDIYSIGYLDSMIGRLKEAEAMYVRALKGYEKAWGAEHTSTLDTVNNLGVLYKNQGKMAEAEAMLLRALKGFKKIYDADHPRVLLVTSNLGLLTSAIN